MVPADDASGEPLSSSFLLEFYKALSDPVRLRIAGVLAAGAVSTAELARQVDAPAPAVARHLAKLVEVGVALRLDGGRYVLDREGLKRRAETGLDSPRVRELAGATDERSRVLAALMRNGRLTTWPTGDQRKLVVLRELAKRFEPGRSYSEREVNEVLKAVYDDYTTLRRALVDYHIMNRYRGVYWLGEGQLDDTSQPEEAG